MGIAVLVLCVCGLAAATLTRSAGTADSPRPLVAPQQARAWRAIPLGLSLGAIVGGASLGGRAGGLVMITGLLSALVSLPLAAPALLPTIGRALARRRSVAALIAGRRLQRDPRRIGRPFGLYGVIVLLAIVSGCYVALLGAYESTPVPEGRYAAVVLRWTDPQPNDVSRLRQQLRPARVIPVNERGDGRLVLGTPAARWPRRSPG